MTSLILLMTQKQFRRNCKIKDTIEDTHIIRKWKSEYRGKLYLNYNDWKLTNITLTKFVKLNRKKKENEQKKGRKRTKKGRKTDKKRTEKRKKKKLTKVVKSNRKEKKTDRIKERKRTETNKHSTKRHIFASRITFTKLSSVGFC